MDVTTIANPGGMMQQQLKPAEQIDTGRKNKEALTEESQESSVNQKIQPEELLDSIKSLTDGGLYSVRFEQDDDMQSLVVKIFDNNTQEVIRQIPAEAILNFKASFEELVGNLVNTQV